MICVLLGSCNVIKWTLSVGRVGIPDEMRTSHLQNTSEQHYRLRQLNESVLLRFAEGKITLCDHLRRSIPILGLFDRASPS